MEEIIDRLREIFGVNAKTEEIKAALEHFNVLREKILGSMHPLATTLDEMIKKCEIRSPDEFATIFAACIHTLLSFLISKHGSDNLFLGVVTKLAFFANLNEKNPTKCPTTPLFWSEN